MFYVANLVYNAGVRSLDLDFNSVEEYWLDLFFVCFGAFVK